MQHEQSQRHIIAAALFSTKSTALLPSPYEQRITQQYVAGQLSIQRVIELLEEYNYAPAAPSPTYRA
jgi:hypothetical protein